MSRRGGRGGGKRGPDLSWDDAPELPSGQATPTEKKKPAPRFPKRDFNVPRPITVNELAGVKSYLSFRDAVHKGPYYSVLQSSNLTDDKGKVHKRAGFDPFNDQEKYTAKYQRKKQTVPDLSSRQYRTFSFELSNIDYSHANTSALISPSHLPTRTLVDSRSTTQRSTLEDR